jgi:Ca2+-binding RTX toxin-like protein
VVDAGQGNDLVLWSPVAGADSLDGGDGTDTLDILGGGWTTVDGGNGYTQYNISGGSQFFFGRNFETVLCFATGTLIATPRGEVPVEALRAGDLVLTRHGPGIKRIRWIGEQAFDGRFIAADRAPVRIRAGTLGNGLPRRDLVVSPAHAVLVGGVLVDARLLVNGDSIVQERVAGTIAYRHIDLGEHDCVLAEGAWAESYRETGDRRAFLNAASAVERDVEPPCLPHVSAADDPRLPALRARLAVPVARRA